MTTIPNTQILLASRPQGEACPSNFRIVKTTAFKDIPSGHILIRNLFLSVDPTMRNWMNPDRNSYSPPVEIGEVFRSFGLGEVVESKSSKFKKGDIVHGLVGFQDYAILKEDSKLLCKIPENYLQQFPLTNFLSIFGMPGITAYLGLSHIAEPKEGETVLVSTAAGAVGSLVGQMCKLKGCRVVGITGSDEKIAYVVNELGFDAAINYKKVQNLSEEIRRHCPKGVDIYWDNVGGEILDTALEHINLFGRVVFCGALSTYNVDMDKTKVYPLRNYVNILKKRVKFQGFILFDHPEEIEAAQRQLVDWTKQKKLKVKEEIVFGLEHAPEALHKLFQGTTCGKMVIQVTRELPATK